MKSHSVTTLFKILSAVLFIIFSSNDTSGQFIVNTKFDYELLEGKTLWIPLWDVDDKTMKKMLEKDKYEEYEALARSATSLNEMWNKVMSGSSYDATPYILKKYTYNEFRKEKPEDAIGLVIKAYTKGASTNYMAELIVAKPKFRTIASALINDLDITDENDLRLIINMLNQSLNTAIELDQNENANRSGVMNKYKQNFVDFFDQIDTKTFLAPVYPEEDKNSAELNNELKEALTEWNISKVEMVTEYEINEKRKEKSTCCFYWKNIPYRVGLITQHVNLIINTENDEVLFIYWGKGKLKSGNIQEAQTKMLKRSEKYKEQILN